MSGIAMKHGHGPPAAAQRFCKEIYISISAWSLGYTMLDPYYPLRCESQKNILVSVSAIKHGGSSKITNQLLGKLDETPNFLIAQRKRVRMQDTVPLVLTFSIVVGFYFPNFRRLQVPWFFPLTLTAPASNALCFMKIAHGFDIDLQKAPFLFGHLQLMWNPMALSHGWWVQIPEDHLRSTGSKVNRCCNWSYRSESRPAVMSVGFCWGFAPLTRSNCFRILWVLRY